MDEKLRQAVYRSLVGALARRSATPRRVLLGRRSPPADRRGKARPLSPKLPGRAPGPVGRSPRHQCQRRRRQERRRRCPAPGREEWRRPEFSSARTDCRGGGCAPAIVRSLPRGARPVCRASGCAPGMRRDRRAEPASSEHGAATAAQTLAEPRSHPGASD